MRTGRDASYVDSSSPQAYHTNNSPQFNHGKRLIDAQAPLIIGPILDIGSGDGRLTDYLTSAVKQDVTGVDISAERVQFANKTYSHTHLRFFQADATKLRECREILANKYKTIVSFNALHHLSQQEHISAFKQVYDLLDDSGTILFLIPAMIVHLEDAIGEVEHSPKWQPLFMGFNYQAIRTFESKDYYKALCQGAGFSSIDINMESEDSGIAQSMSQLINFLRGFLPHLVHLRNQLVEEVKLDEFLKDVATLYFSKMNKKDNEEVSITVVNNKIIARH